MGAEGGREIAILSNRENLPQSSLRKGGRPKPKKSYYSVPLGGRSQGDPL